MLAYRAPSVARARARMHAHVRVHERIRTLRVPLLKDAYVHSIGATTEGGINVRQVVDIVNEYGAHLAGFEESDAVHVG